MFLLKSGNEGMTTKSMWKNHLKRSNFASCIIEGTNIQIGYTKSNGLAYIHGSFVVL